MKHRPSFSMRKKSIGLVSVLLGVFFSGANQVAADGMTSGEIEVHHEDIDNLTLAQQERIIPEHVKPEQVIDGVYTLVYQDATGQVYGNTNLPETGEQSSEFYSLLLSGLITASGFIILRKNRGQQSKFLLTMTVMGMMYATTVTAQTSLSFVEFVIKSEVKSKNFEGYHYIGYYVDPIGQINPLNLQPVYASQEQSDLALQSAQTLYIQTGTEDLFENIGQVIELAESQVNQEVGPLTSDLDQSGHVSEIFLSSMLNDEGGNGSESLSTISSLSTSQENTESGVISVSNLVNQSGETSVMSSISEYSSQSLSTIFVSTSQPTGLPTLQPTVAPTSLPTSSPTLQPTAAPTLLPTFLPTLEPTMLPTAAPTSRPTLEPTVTPTLAPTTTPTVTPTTLPTLEPTMLPTAAPTSSPTLQPTAVPTAAPTVTPTTLPTLPPTAVPTAAPTSSPTLQPTAVPTAAPTVTPTTLPTLEPTMLPTAAPTSRPTLEPTMLPTAAPTSSPTLQPTAVPTAAPTVTPTTLPTLEPTMLPTAMPTVAPTSLPTSSPTFQPTAVPTAAPDDSAVLDAATGEALNIFNASLNDIETILAEDTSWLTQEIIDELIKEAENARQAVEAAKPAGVQLAKYNEYLERFNRLVQQLASIQGSTTPTPAPTPAPDTDFADAETAQLVLTLTNSLNVLEKQINNYTSNINPVRRALNTVHADYDRVWPKIADKSQYKTLLDRYYELTTRAKELLSNAGSTTPQPQALVSEAPEMEQIMDVTPDLTVSELARRQVVENQLNVNQIPEVEEIDNVEEVSERTLSDDNQERDAQVAETNEIQETAARLELSTEDTWPNHPEQWAEEPIASPIPVEVHLHSTEEIPAEVNSHSIEEIPVEVNSNSTEEVPVEVPVSDSQVSSSNHYLSEMVAEDGTAGN